MTHLMCTLRCSLTVWLAAVCLAATGWADSFDWGLPGIEGRTSGQWQLWELVSAKGEEEVYQSVVDPHALGLTVTIAEEALAANATVVRVTVRNEGEATQFLKSAFKVVPALDGFQWWNGYSNRLEVQFDPQDVTLSQWFPANAALGDAYGISLGLDPLEVFSRVDSSISEDGRELLLEIPFVLGPGEERTTSFVITSFPTRFGYRDVVQNYYDLFPHAYQPVADVHPSVISSQSTYLFWKPSTYNVEHAEDMIRRFTGGYGGWEWCYAPFLRGGDWAVTYEWSEGFRGYSRSKIDQHRASIRERLAPAGELNVAAMYYVNVLWTERTLAEEHFPEVLSNPRARRAWGNEAVFGLYPWGNRYGDLFAESIRNIAEWYPQSHGIAWDSAFGHLRADESVAGVLETEFRSFDQGEQFVLVGVGYTPLMDLNRSLDSAEGYRRANAVNLKLVSPYFLGVRSDSALYEGHPVEAPNRLMRFEVMRANLGSPKALSWHKNMVPSHLRWIDWDALDAVQVRDTMRQLYQDILFLSYFWGGIPSPGMPTLGVPFVFDQVPTLIELVRKGWQPAPAVEGGENLLFARYGQGAGAVIAVINPEFEAQSARLQFPAEYWDGKNVLLARRDHQTLRSQIAALGTSSILEIPPRSIVLLDVVGLLDTTGYKGDDHDTVISEAKNDSDGRVGWSFTMETYAIRDWSFELAAAGDGFRDSVLRIGRDSKVIAAEEPVEFSLSSSRWPDDVQEMNRRSGKFALIRNPQVVLGVDAGKIAELGWFAAQGGGTSVHYDHVSEQVQEQIGQQLEHWFSLYTANVLQAPEQPQLLSGDGGVQLIFRQQAGDDQQDGASIQLENETTLVLQAETADGLVAATNALLLLLDRAFPYYGHLYREDEVLEFAELSGKVLGEEMESGFILKPTLSERLQRHYTDF